MAKQRDVVKVQILFGVARGAGGLRVSPQGAAWLHGRYVPWLEMAKPEVGHSPLEVWEESGRGFLAKFNEIGTQARAGAAGVALTAEALQAAASRVEGESVCPYCPLPGTAGPARVVAAEDAAFVQMVFALASGTGSLRLSAAAAGWFQDRYAPWLVTRKPGRIESPVEIWEEHGRGFLARFKAIGQGARSLTAGDEIGLDALRASARQVEGESSCPWCPVPPPARETAAPEAWKVPVAGALYESASAHA